MSLVRRKSESFNDMTVVLISHDYTRKECDGEQKTEKFTDSDINSHDSGD